MLVVACGSSSSPAAVPTPTMTVAAIPTARLSAADLLDWPEFGLNPQRSDVERKATGITAANVAHLRHLHVTLAGTVDSSPIYLHGAPVDGATTT